MIPCPAIAGGCTLTTAEPPRLQGAVVLTQYIPTKKNTAVYPTNSFYFTLFLMVGCTVICKGIGVYQFYVPGMLGRALNR